ncbi:MAG: hypothetical protein E7249_16785 [Paenibacillaceae bacterium]|nr:hypothetical protein [Paenibacillaceae bacterium]
MLSSTAFITVASADTVKASDAEPDKAVKVENVTLHTYVGEFLGSCIEKQRNHGLGLQSEKVVRMKPY